MPSSEVMGKYKRGTLRSGSGGKVKSRDQAIAIMMSERRNEAKHGGHYKEGGHHSPPPMTRGLGSMPTYSTPGTGHGHHPTAVKVNKSSL